MGKNRFARVNGKKSSIPVSFIRMTNKSFLSGRDYDTVGGLGALLADSEQRLTPFFLLLIASSKAIHFRYFILNLIG